MRLKQHRWYIGEGGIGEMLTLALPMITATACDGIMTFTDRFFLANISPELMNAAMAGGVMVQTLMFFFIGLIGYSTAMVAQYLGAGRKGMCSVVAFQAIVISILAVPFIMMLKPVGIFFINNGHIPIEQSGFQIVYYSILINGVILSLVRNALSCYFSGIGRTNVVMIATLVALVVNILLDYILIFGHFGFPALGIRGAAYATLSGSFFSVVIMLVAYFSRWNMIRYSVEKSFRINFQVIKQMLWYGFPAGLEFFLNFMAFSMMIMIFHSQGNIVATASTIMFNWDLISYIPLMGIEIAVTSLAGRYIGAGKPDIAHRSAKSAIFIGIFYSLVVFVFFVFFPEQLVRVFSADVKDVVFEQSVPLAVTMIRLASLYVFAQAIMVALIGTLRGAGDTHFTMILSVSANWILVPVLYLIMNVIGLSPAVGWFALVIVFLCFCFALYQRFKKGKWKQLNVINRF